MSTLFIVLNGLVIGLLGSQTSLSFPVRVLFYVASCSTVIGYGYFKSRGQ